MAFLALMEYIQTTHKRNTDTFRYNGAEQKGE